MFQNKLIKTLIFICALSTSSLLMAGEDCYKATPAAPAAPHSKLGKLAENMALIAAKSSNDKTVTLEAATTFLTAVGNGINFKDEDAHHFISKLTPLCEDNRLNNKFRSLACTRLSGLHGKMVQKNKMNAISSGKNAFKYVKLAIKLDNTNRDAILGHAVSVVELFGQSFFIKKVIESNLGASFVAEAKFAKVNLERVKLRAHPLYARVLEIN